MHENLLFPGLCAIISFTFVSFFQNGFETIFIFLIRYLKLCAILKLEEMIMLSESEIFDIKKAEKVMFVTSNKIGQPRAIWVIPSEINSDLIILSNIQMNQSFDNILENSKVFINVLLPEKNDLQYKITGVASIETNTNDFYRIKKFEESENLPPELKVRSIIKVKITNLEKSNG